MIKSLFFSTYLMAIVLPFISSSIYAQKKTQPNFIIILTDDQGYNDLGCYGSKKIKTPYIDQMALEGMKLTNFHVSAPLCGPSRASLLTGCYPMRLAEKGNVKNFHTIIDSSEILISEILKNKGYKTGVIGKWHLAGSNKETVHTSKEKKGLAKYRLVNPNIMPIKKGFDYYYGIPYSNDMTPTVLMEGNTFVEELGMKEKQIGISTKYTNKALEFITTNKDSPFFLYLSHAMPHKPLWPSKDFEGKSKGGLYGDCIEEIDWNVGRILGHLKKLNLDKNTIVIFTSDNGPYIGKPKPRATRVGPRWNQGGSAYPLRGYKLTTHDGGLRVPFIIRYPEKIKAGQTSNALITSLDIMPTLTKLAGAKIPKDRVIDGINMTDFFMGKTKKSPRKDFYYYKWTHLHAVTDGDWKLVLPREAKSKKLKWYSRIQEEVTEITLYNLIDDIGETTNVAHLYPNVLDRLKRIVTKAQNDLGDGRVHIKSTGTRKTTNEK